MRRPKSLQVQGVRPPHRSENNSSRTASSPHPEAGGGDPQAHGAHRVKPGETRLGKRTANRIAARQAVPRRVPVGSWRVVQDRAAWPEAYRDDETVRGYAVLSRRSDAPDALSVQAAVKGHGGRCLLLVKASATKPPTWIEAQGAKFALIGLETPMAAWLPGGTDPPPTSAGSIIFYEVDPDDAFGRRRAGDAP